MNRGLVMPIVLQLAGGITSPAGSAPPPVPATLADVSFMAGHWLGGAYRRGEGETLTGVLEKGGKKEEFRFRRKP